MEEKYFTPEEVAETLKVHVRTIYNLIASGKLMALKVGVQYRIAQSAIDQLSQNGNTVVS